MKHIIICMLFLTASALTHAASFDCALAATTIEKTICADAQLSDLDSQLAQSYKESRSTSANADLLKSEQRVWLASVRNKCEDAECLRQVYAARIATIDAPNLTTEGNAASAATLEREDNQAPKPDTFARQPASVLPLPPPESASNAPSEKPPQQSVESLKSSSVVGSGAVLQLPPSAEPKPTASSGKTVMAEVFRVLFLVGLLAMIAGLIRPSILAKFISPLSRKKVFGIGLVYLIVLGSLDNLMKPPEQFAQEASARKANEAEKAAKRASQEALTSPAKGPSSNTSDDQCINAALNVGYVDGMCAYSYINACVTTGSGSEMNQQLAITKMMGRVNERGCSSMPTTYVNQFNAAYSRRDRF